jgi:hypothetical protein
MLSICQCELFRPKCCKFCRHNAERFLRPVDVLLVFPNSNMLLNSEREADNILALAWQISELSTLHHEMKIKFAHLSHLKGESCHPMLISGKRGEYFFRSLVSNKCSVVVLCAQLFNSKTIFAPARKEVLSKITMCLSS